MSKICARCHNEKPEDQFKTRKFKRGNTGFCSYCHICELEYRAAHKRKQRKKLKNEFSEANQESYTPELQKQDDEKTLQRKAYMRQYYLDNKEKIHGYINKYRKSNPLVKLRDSIRSRLLECIYKRKHTEEYLGSSIIIVKLWIESNFQAGMTWGNHGDVWQIDHTVPISLFDAKNETDINICFNWKNLYPMYCKDNNEKKNHLLISLIQERIEKLQVFCRTNDLEQQYNEYITCYNDYIKKFSTKNILIAT
jgi:hypothetical protein